MADGPYYKKNRNAIEFYKARADKYEKDSIGGYWFFIYSPCPQLDLSTGLCNIYEKRPIICRRFPEPEHTRGILKYICKRIRTICKTSKVGSYKKTLTY